MAVIGKIRERSTLVLVIIGLAIVAFVLTDLFSAKAGGQTGPINLAEIDGETISPQEFEIRVQEAYQNYLSNAQNNQQLDERTKSSIREQVWNEVVSDEIIGAEIKKLGIIVTRGELMDMVSGKNPHPQVRQAFSNPETGEFNSMAVIQFLQNLDQNPEGKKQWLAFEKALKRNQHIEKYNSLIKQGMYTPNLLAKMQADETNTKLSFDYVLKPYIAIADEDVTVSDAELEKYYKENLHRYQQGTSRKAYYAYFPVGPSELDVENTRRWAQDTYAKFLEVEDDSVFTNNNSDGYFDPTYYSVKNIPMGADTSLWNKEVGFIKEPYMIEKTFYIQKVRNVKMAPDSVMASHILINISDRLPDRAEEIADSLMALINSGSDFAELAKENSDDVDSGANGGDLGWFTEGTMVKPFNDAAFKTEVGEIVKVNTQFGVHLIKVTDKTGLEKKIQIATISRTATPSKETYEEVFNRANSFSIKATDLESFNNLVNEENIQRRVTVLTESQNSIQGEGSSRDLVRWIKSANVDDVSDAYDLDDAFAVAVIEEVNEEGPAPLEKVKATVTAEVIKQKKAETIKEELKSATTLDATGLQVKNASDISFVSPSIPSVGIEPKVFGKVFSLQKGQMSVPIAGNSGVFVIKITDRVEIASPNLNLVKSNLQRSNKAKVDNGLVFTALKDQADIVDNRAKFY